MRLLWFWDWQAMWENTQSVMAAMKLPGPMSFQINILNLSVTWRKSNLKTFISLTNEILIIFISFSKKRCSLYLQAHDLYFCKYSNKIFDIKKHIVLSTCTQKWETQSVGMREQQDHIAAFENNSKSHWTSPWFSDSPWRLLLEPSFFILHCGHRPPSAAQLMWCSALQLLHTSNTPSRQKEET
jgi:hypothetical protein